MLQQRMMMMLLPAWAQPIPINPFEDQMILFYIRVNSDFLIVCNVVFDRTGGIVATCSVYKAC